eukprot:Lankesteria_metandrocarpae@DN3711_c0_g1_i4.p1
MKIKFFDKVVSLCKGNNSVRATAPKNLNIAPTNTPVGDVDNNMGVMCAPDDAYCGRDTHRKSHWSLVAAYSLGISLGKRSTIANMQHQTSTFDDDDTGKIKHDEHRYDAAVVGHANTTGAVPVPVDKECTGTDTKWKAEEENNNKYHRAVAGDDKQSTTSASLKNNTTGKENTGIDIHHNNSFTGKNNSNSVVEGFGKRLGSGVFVPATVQTGALVSPGKIRPSSRRIRDPRTIKGKGRNVSVGSGTPPVQTCSGNKVIEYLELKDGIPRDYTLRTSLSLPGAGGGLLLAGQISTEGYIDGPRLGIVTNSGGYYTHMTNNVMRSIRATTTTTGNHVFTSRRTSSKTSENKKSGTHRSTSRHQQTPTGTPTSVSNRQYVIEVGGRYGNTEMPFVDLDCKPMLSPVVRVRHSSLHKDSLLHRGTPSSSRVVGSDRKMRTTSFTGGGGAVAG